MWGNGNRVGRGGTVSALALAALLAGAAPAALAQDAGAEVRLRKIEAEVRALQRKVFPGGDEKFFRPEVSPGTAPATATPGVPTTSAVTDLLTRMDAIEAQLARLTGQTEENANRIGVLEARAGITRTGEAVAVPGAVPATAPTVTATPASAPVAVALPGGTGAAPVAAKPAVVTPAAPAASGPTAGRLAAVRAIEKPQTGDPADDEYSYGFRLWEAGFYPEARQQLKMFVEKYPRHQRISWGRNLLGRAYLDEGQPAEAAKWFLQNYQSDKAGGRAPDSLLYLATAMKRLKDDKRACIALAEFSTAYAAEAAGRLKGQYDETRRGLTCPS